MTSLLHRALRKARRLLRLNATAPLGIYGSPNAGKSSLANVFCEDWSGEVLSSVSDVPHETREVRSQRLRLTDGHEELIVDVMDTPGLSSRVTGLELEVFHGMSAAQAEARAREALDGMMRAMKALERVEGILLVIDSTTDPHDQVNEVLVTNALARKTPLIVVANKIDLPGADVEGVRAAFGRHFPVVPVSAKTRENIPALYQTMFRVFDG